MFRMAFIALALATPAAALATGGSGSEPDQNNLTGGALVRTGELPEIVFIRAAATSGDQDCTATLIDPNGLWLLTAARCIPDDTPADGITAWGGSNGDQSPIASASWVAHPNWDNEGTGTRGFDIAAIQLAAPIDAPAMPVNDAPLDEDSIDSGLTAIGYGPTSQGADDGRTKRRGDTRVVDLGIFTNPDIPGLQDRLFAFNGNVGGCGEDLGGPGISYVNGSAILTSILSQTATPCASEPDEHTRVDVHLDWLKARGVPFILGRGRVTPAQCRVTDGTFDTSRTMGVVPFTRQCAYPEDGVAWWMEWGDDTRDDGPDVVRRFETPGLYGQRTCTEIADGLGGTEVSCVGSRQAFIACAEADAAFTKVDVDAITHSFSVADPSNPIACLDDQLWQVFDSDDALVLESDERIAVFTFERAGDYRVVHTVNGFAGEATAEQSLTIEPSSGCNSLGAPVSWSLTGLVFGIGWTRRRRGES
ncbi:MAG: trypsin-like serine protease [Myxococcota bacterium]